MIAGSPSVTALLPAYNAAAFIDETLQSLAAQTYPHFRVLISVDASTDDTADRCERFARGDARFAVVRQSQRLGWVANGQELLRRAESELCFFISHDDVIEPGYVTALVDALNQNPRTVLAYSDLHITSQSGRQTIMQYAGMDGIVCKFGRARVALSRTGWGVTYRGLFRTSVARCGRPLQHNLAGEFAADWPFLVHFALRGECVRVPQLLYRKRFKPTSLSATFRHGMFQWIAVALCCNSMLNEVRFTRRERMILLATLALLISKQIVMRLRSLVGRALRRAGMLRPI